MFLCRTGRLSAAALDQALKSPGSFLVQVRVNRLRRLSLTAHSGHTVPRQRLCCCASVGGAEPSRAHLDKQHADPVHGWDASCGLVTTDWGHLHRVATVAVHLSKSAQPEGGGSDTVGQPRVYANRRHNSRQPAGHGLFTGTWEVPSPRCSTRTMQTRASSTAAAKKKSEEQADGNKEDVPTSTETSTTSPPEKVSGGTEPEGGKPNKTQQLKKVFKEYGAVGVSFHIGISLMSLGMFYLLISSGIDMATILCKVGFSEAIVQSKMAAGTSTFVLAYAIHKLFAPLRISITLVSVPLIVRYFRKTGLFKPPSPAP